MNTNATSFWDPIPTLKTKTIRFIKKVNDKAPDGKLVTVNDDRGLFERRCIA